MAHIFCYTVLNTTFGKTTCVSPLKCILVVFFLSILFTYLYVQNKLYSLILALVENLCFVITCSESWYTELFLCNLPKICGPFCSWPKWNFRFRQRRQSLENQWCYLWWWKIHTHFHCSHRFKINSVKISC